MYCSNTLIFYQYCILVYIILFIIILSWLFYGFIKALVSFCIRFSFIYIKSFIN